LKLRHQAIVFEASLGYIARPYFKNKQMFITNHQGNATQNHSEISAPSHQNNHHPKKKKIANAV
jgi:hypothetical protein